MTRQNAEKEFFFGVDSITNDYLTFMRENGIEGSSKWPWLSTAGNKAGSYDPQQRMMLLLQERSVQERFEVLKGFQEWVQEPALEHLSTLKTMKDYE